MDRDTFSHIRLWCPRPFGTYSQNKARSAGSGASGGGPRGRPGSPSLCKVEGSIAGRVPPEGGGDEGREMAVAEQGENVAVELGDDDDDDVGSENTPPEPDPPSAPSPTSTSPPPAPSAGTPSPPSSGAQMEEGRVLLDTWYVIKPGNTKEKIAFFVAHQFSGEGLQRPIAMKVSGGHDGPLLLAKE